MKRVVAAGMTLMLLVAAVWYGGHQPSGNQKTADSPLLCVERMFGAAVRGSVADYLDCFAGAERTRMERSFAGESGAAAEASLRGTVADLKGWAVVDPPTDVVGYSCTLELERVYAGRVDRQRLELQKEKAPGDVWRIHAVESSRPSQPPIAYGTPIYATESAGSESADAEARSGSPR